jgi:hypothetical protein
MKLEGAPPQASYSCLSCLNLSPISYTSLQKMVCSYLFIYCYLKTVSSPVSFLIVVCEESRHGGTTWQSYGIASLRSQ